jgi:serine phosphatase RsbU (regulator of sigma subunit)
MLRCIKIFILFIVTLSSVKVNGQISPESKVKAVFIHNFTKQIEWPKDQNFDKFTITVLGRKNKELDSALKLAISKKNFNGKPYEVKLAKSILDIGETQLLYVNADDGFDGNRILRKIKGRGILLVTENYKDFNKSMISFIQEEGKQKFAVNELLIQKEGLKCSELLLRLAVLNEQAWKDVYDKYKQLLKSDNEKITVSKEDLKEMIETNEQQNQKLADAELKHEKSLDEIEQLSFEAQAQELKIKMQNDEIRKKKLEAKNKEQENELLKKEKLFHESESASQRLILILVISALVVILIFTFFILRSWYFTKKQNEIIAMQKARVEQQSDIILQSKKTIEEKNKDITDSITYAQRIQQAKLPDIFEVNNELKESFILFKPKDIVSGDFYFFQKNVNGSYLAAVDCTGHGVPGAFMSLIGSDKLEDALSQFSEPSEILNHLNKSLKKSLRQNRKDDTTRDGMDIALCWLDLKNFKLKFSGANRPLWIFREGKTLLEEYKPTKKSIGGFTEDNEVFEMHEISLNKGDTLYLFSDGFADTFSATTGKKLTTKKFKEVLASIQNLSMKEQGNHLEKFIEEWKAGEEQVDDILVVGLRV